MSGSAIQYPSPSDQNQQFFRLLDVVEQDRSGNITCRRFPVEFSQFDVVSYTAISYTWEHKTPDAGCSVTVNGHRVAVQQNVFDLLESLLASGERKPVFIDALCIDQTSVHDKNTQVAHMGKVYYNASKVLVWFGKIQACFQRELQMLLTENHVQRSSTGNGSHVNILRLKDSHVIHWIATHPYWKRLWIVQELMLAQDVVFRASTLDIEWQVLVRWFDLDKFRKGDLPPYMGRPSDLLRWRRRLTNQFSDRRNSLGIIDAFSCFGTQDCLDVRDKLYGLCALLDIKVTPDYRKSNSEVYSETILAGLKEIDAHEDLVTTSLKLGWHKAEDKFELIRVWCAKASNIFDIDVHAQEIPDVVRTALEEGVLLGRTRFLCTAFLLLGDEGCRVCAGASSNGDCVEEEHID